MKIKIDTEERREGFWKSHEEPDLPMPVARDTRFKNQTEFLKMLAVKERRARARRFRGWSTCRICGKSNGSVTYELGDWSWPEGFRHYVRDHNVRPSKAFYRFIMRTNE